MVTKGKSLNALKEWSKPESPRDWSRLALGFVFALFMLLAGRLWGESLIEATTTRALQNEATLQGLETRFEDHVTVEARQHQQILDQLREIREMLQSQ